MRNKIRHIALLATAFLLASPCKVFGQEEVLRPVLSSYSLEVGGKNLTQTYLSPLKYSGIGLALDYERMQSMRFNPEKWVMKLDGRLAYDCGKNPVGNARMYNIKLSLGWSMTHRWKLKKGFTVLAGGNTSISGGADYTPRNSNNPVAANASWTVGATGSAIWNGKFGRLPVCIRYQATLPLAGCFFCPEYGELYYEIYLGNRKGLVHGAWPGNYFNLDNLASIDFRFGNTILRAGYRCEVFSSKANHIVSRSLSNSFVLGIVSEWISIGTKKTNFDNARIISALY